MTDATKALDALMGANAAPRDSGSEGLSIRPGAPADARPPVPPRRDAADQAFEGGFASVIRAVLGQAASGLKDAARDVDARTGVASKANEALARATGGRDVDALLTQARELVSQNKLAAGATIGGLAAILLGTGTGRGVAATTAKLGGLAVIGGLAYKAFQNYQAGKSLIDLGGPLEPAPAESPFGDTTDKEQDRRTAMLMVRTMIAAAAADGAIDNAERRLIVGGLERAGIEADAASLLDREFARPASIDALIAEASSREIAIQAYTAARLAVDSDQPSEREFLARLAAGLKLEPELIRSIDAAVQKPAQQN